MSKTAKWIVGILVAVAVIGIAIGYSQGPTTSLKGERAGLQDFKDGAKLGSANVEFKDVSIGAEASQTAYCNTQSGRRQFVDLGVLRTSGTASTTQVLTMGTSTASTFNQFSVGNALKSFLSFTLATSAPAQTVNTANAYGATTGAGGGVAELAVGECLNVGIYQTYGTACTGATCETASSTNRGFNVTGFIRVITP